MATSVVLQPAFVLHRQAFRNSSLIIDFFTFDYGRLRVVARAARGAPSRQRHPLQPFQPLVITAGGRGELLSLQSTESESLPLQLGGVALFSGLYLNELLLRLLPLQESASSLFAAYHQALVALHSGVDLEPTLREFELLMLAELGYAIDLMFDQRSGATIVAGQQYLFNASGGFEAVAGGRNESSDAVIVSGDQIIAMRNRQWLDAGTRRAAKRVLRRAIDGLLDGKPLMSRRLFQRPRS